jgi:cytochrome c biogenesis protein CcmG/thiol:disulfide interchange protein DsbE
MRFSRFLIPLAAFLAIGLLLAVGLRLNPREVPSPLIDRLAPDFRLPRLLAEGLEFGTADQRGHVWVLNVWASWCIACRTEHQLLHDLADSGVVDLVGLNYKDEHTAATSWLRSLGNPYNRIAVDSIGDVAIDWGVYGVPETFVIDADGVIRYKHIGPLNSKILHGKILPLVRRLSQKTG